MTRFRIEWQTNGIEIIDIQPDEEIPDFKEYIDEIVKFAKANTTEWDLYEESEDGWVQKL